MRILLFVLATLILLIGLVAMLRNDSLEGVPPAESAHTAKATEYPAGTRLVVGISGHPYMYMMKDEKTIKAMAHSKNAEELMSIVSQSIAAGGGRLIPYGTKAVLALSAKPNAEWVVARISEGIYADEIGFLLGSCPYGSSDCSPQFRYSPN